MTNHHTPNFGEWFLAELQQRDLRAAEAADAMDIQQSSISRWRTSSQMPSFKTMRLVSQYLRLPMIDVLIAAGYISEEEAGIEPNVDHLRLVDGAALGTEVLRRLQILDSMEDDISDPIPATRGRRRARLPD